MREPRPSFVAYPPIGRHGVIGDRRTDALVAADGTVDWFCAPEFDGQPVFGSLLDIARGGFCVPTGCRDITSREERKAAFVLTIMRDGFSGTGFKHPDDTRTSVLDGNPPNHFNAPDSRLC